MPIRSTPTGSEPPSRPLWRRGWIGRAFVLVLGSMIATFSCSSRSGYSCGPGETCGCQGEFSSECYLACNGDNCRLDCSNTGAACGTVCGNGCDAFCHDTPECSHYCRDGCKLDCYGTPVCGAVCGANCEYTCHDAQKCAVRVGPGGRVKCTSVSTCEVECEGDCEVQCVSVDACNIACLRDDLRKTYDSGTYSCL